MHLNLRCAKPQYKIDHTHVYGWVRGQRCACMWNYKDREGLLQTATKKKTKSTSAPLLDTDKLCSMLHVNLSCLGCLCAYYRVVHVRPGRIYAPKSKYALQSQVHLKTCAYGMCAHIMCEQYNANSTRNCLFYLLFRSTLVLC